jgi:hypothetical protein
MKIETLHEVILVSERSSQRHALAAFMFSLLAEGRPEGICITMVAARHEKSIIKTPII